MRPRFLSSARSACSQERAKRPSGDTPNHEAAEITGPRTDVAPDPWYLEHVL